MKNRTLATILAPALAAGVLWAQNPKTQALLMAFGANGKQMTAYLWKQKTTVIRKGTPSATIIEEVRFDASGRPQRITLSKPEEKKMGMFKAKKVAQVKDLVEDVMQLAGRYANPQQVGQAIQKGEIWEGNGALKVQARYVVLPQDEMVMLVNASTFLPTRIDFKTQFEGDPVLIGIDYQQLANGPSMMSRMTVQIPKDDIVVHVESFDYVRLAQ